MSDAVRKHFDELSSSYREHFRSHRTGTSENFRGRLEMACDMARGRTGLLLDCACGTGEITCALLKSGQFPRAVVVDLSMVMLANAKALIEQECTGIAARFVNKSVFEIASEDVGEKADLIVCLGLLAHVGQIEVLLSKLKGLLSPGSGAILLQTSIADHWGVAMTRAVSQRRFAAKAGYHLSYFRHKDICDACDKVGLEVVEWRRHVVGVPFGDRIWARGNHWIERRFATFAGRHGAEALYLISLPEGNDAK